MTAQRWEGANATGWDGDHDGLQDERPATPLPASSFTLHPPADQDLILVGATGDLARRKLIPAIYDLFLDGLLPNNGRIIGYAREETDDETFRLRAANSIRAGARRMLFDEAWRELAPRFVYVPRSKGGIGLAAKHATQNERLIYLAIPPTAVPGVLEEIRANGLIEGSRIVLEKPFGFDLPSARALDEQIREHFDEDKIFRIDHYLGKETVQNISVFRFGNAVWERVWSRDAIDHIQITVGESIGAGGRAAFYDDVGALRDIVQNHALQLLALLTMEPPAKFTAAALRDESARALHALRPIRTEDAIFGQYTAGTVEGKHVRGYLEETGVPKDSHTETFVALRAEIDNWRWAGVPIFIRTGKRLPQRVTEVLVSFREPPVVLWESAGLEADERRSNHLVMRIQPNEGIELTFNAKVPGPEMTTRPVAMRFRYGESFMTEPAEAYERLLYDAMDGDPMLFLRQDSVLRAWEVLQPLIDAPPPVHPYAAGSWGPDAANDLIGARTWHTH
ncbi:MAG: glucose-6-phosphate dehydrogenase [Dehalococcoidia bacterium]